MASHFRQQNLAPWPPAWMHAGLLGQQVKPKPSTMASSLDAGWFTGTTGQNLAPWPPAWMQAGLLGQQVKQLLLVAKSPADILKQKSKFICF